MRTHPYLTLMPRSAVRSPRWWWPALVALVALVALAAVLGGCDLPEPPPVEQIHDGGHDLVGQPPPPACGVPQAPGGRCCLRGDSIGYCLGGYTCMGAYPTWMCW